MTKREIKDRSSLVAWVQTHITDGMEPAEAAQAAFDEAIAEKRAADVLRALGWRGAFYLPWMEANRFERLPDQEPVSIREPLGAPAGRRVDAGVVASDSRYSKLVNVGRHQWVALGDLTKRQCQIVAAAYRARAAANEFEAEVFDALEMGLEDDSTTVRQRFTEAEIEAIRRRKAA
jgi:hypothetical protein